MVGTVFLGLLGTLPLSLYFLIAQPVGDKGEHILANVCPRSCKDLRCPDGSFGMAGTNYCSLYENQADYFLNVEGDAQLYLDNFCDSSVLDHPGDPLCFSFVNCNPFYPEHTSGATCSNAKAAVLKYWLEVSLPLMAVGLAVWTALVILIVKNRKCWKERQCCRQKPVASPLQETLLS